MTFGSLFSGIGGMDLGLERAGMECRWQVEYAEFPRRVLAKHWPNIPQHGDIRSVDGASLERVDLIAGGFPCQDISDAGKRVGIIGERSGLWAEFARILAEVRPRFTLIENVAALRGRGLAMVLQDLWALGFDAEWHCIPACAVGAPHERDRIWILAYAAVGGVESQCLPAEGRARLADTLGLRQVVSDPHRSYEDGRRGPMQMGWLPVQEETAGDGGRCGIEWSAEPGVGRVAHGIPDRVDRLTGIGNAVVPQVAEWIGKRILDSINKESA